MFAYDRIVCSIGYDCKRSARTRSSEQVTSIPIESRRGTPRFYRKRGKQTPEERGTEHRAVPMMQSTANHCQDVEGTRKGERKCTCFHVFSEWDEYRIGNPSQILT
jgi:hypothetical protein